MKALKKDLQGMVKGLMSLAAKAEKMAKGLDKADKGKVGRPPGKRGRPVGRPPAAPAASAGRRRDATAMDMVYDIVARSKKGIDTEAIKEKTGFNDKKIWNAINRLKTQGKIKSARKGVYVKI